MDRSKAWIARRCWGWGEELKFFQIVAIYSTWAKTYGEIRQTSPRVIEIYRGEHMEGGAKVWDSVILSECQSTSGTSTD